MCIALVVHQPASSRYRLLIASNRDEYHHRLSLPVHQWAGERGIIAGKDQEAGGTWLGVSPEVGRPAAPPLQPALAGGCLTPRVAPRPRPRAPRFLMADSPHR